LGMGIPFASYLHHLPVGQLCAARRPCDTWILWAAKSVCREENYQEKKAEDWIAVDAV
jgi:hypothetical protein